MPFNIFFRLGPAIQAIFKLGYEPKESFFYELTPEQYAQLERENGEVTEKYFTIIPDNPKYDIPELLIVDEDQKEALLEGVQYINKLCKDSDKKLSCFQEKLKFAACKLPSIFTEESDFVDVKKKSHLKLVE